MSDSEIMDELRSIRDRFAKVIEELKTKNGIINSMILDIIDDINYYSVEV